MIHHRQRQRETERDRGKERGRDKERDSVREKREGGLWGWTLAGGVGVPQTYNFCLPGDRRAK